MESKQKFKIKKFIKDLSKVRGRHTELISVFIPAGYDIIKIINHLAQEQGTASNIKDKTTRTHVIDSLEKIIRHLRLFKRTPDNGLAVFAGNVAEKEGQTNIEVFSVEPPKPLDLRLYRCDQTFVLEPLLEMVEENDVYGLVVMDRKEGTIGLLKGSHIDTITNLTSGVPGKTRAGGQCIIPSTIVQTNNGNKKIKEIEVGDTLKTYDFINSKFKFSKCIDKWTVKKDKIFRIRVNSTKLETSKDHLFFTKEGDVKAAEELKKNDYLLNDKGKSVKISKIEIIKKPTQMIDISVKNKNFIANGLIVHNSAKRFESLREIAAKEFYKRIGSVVNKEFLNMKNLKGIIVGGPGHTKQEFVDGDSINNQLKPKIIGILDLSYTGDFGLQELVDKSKDLLAKEEVMKEKELMIKFFTLLGKEPNKVVYGISEIKKALELGAVDIILISENVEDEIISELEEEAEKTSANVQIISIESREGEQLKEIGGIAAILRFPLA